MKFVKLDNGAVMNLNHVFSIIPLEGSAVRVWGRIGGMANIKTFENDEQRDEFINNLIGE